MSLQNGQMPTGTQQDSILAAYEREKELAKRKKKEQGSLLTQGFQPQKKRTILTGDGSNPYV